MPGSGTFGERFGFAIVTLVLAVPLSAIGAAQARLSGLVVVWAGIVAVNLIHARSPRGRAKGRGRRLNEAVNRGRRHFSLAGV
ncbi:hypothetical protein GCM10020254_51160 [Streptomyces goshikiensis]